MTSRSCRRGSEKRSTADRPVPPSRLQRTTGRYKAVYRCMVRLIVSPPAWMGYRKAVNRRSAHIPRAGSCRHAFSPCLRMFSCNSSCDLNGDNEDVTISANDGRASSCNMSVSRLMRRRDDTKVCTDPPARVTNNRRDQAIRPPYYGDHFFSRPRCSYLMLAGQVATTEGWGTPPRGGTCKPPRGPTQFEGGASRHEGRLNSSGSSWPVMIWTS